MRELLSGVPGLLWIALAFALMAVWANDVRGIYIAGACAVLGVVQIARGRHER